MTANYGSDSIVAALLDYDDEVWVRRLGRKRVLLCPGCGEPVHLKAPTQRVWHFAHYQTTRSCFPRNDADYDPETPEHRWAKAALARWLAGRPGSDGPLFGQARIVVESRIPETGQFADVLCTTAEGQRVAFEVQVSPLSVSDWKKRAALYASAGVADVWLLCGPRWTRARSRLDSLAAALLRERGRVIYLDVPEDLLDTGRGRSSPGAISRDGRTPWQHRLERAMSGFVVTCLDGVARAFGDADGTPGQEEERQLGLPLAQRSPYLYARAWAQAPDRFTSNPFRESGVFRGGLPGTVIAPHGGPGGPFFASETHEAEAARASTWDKASAAWTAAYGDEIKRARRPWSMPAMPEHPRPTNLQTRQGSLWDGQRTRTGFDWKTARKEDKAKRAREETQEEYTCSVCGRETTDPPVVRSSRSPGGRIVKCRDCVGILWRP